MIDWKTAYVKTVSQEGGYEDSRIMEIGFHAGFTAGISAAQSDEFEPLRRLVGEARRVHDMREKHHTPEGWRRADEAYQRACQTVEFELYRLIRQGTQP